MARVILATDTERHAVPDDLLAALRTRCEADGLHLFSSMTENGEWRIVVSHERRLRTSVRRYRRDEAVRDLLRRLDA